MSRTIDEQLTDDLEQRDYLRQLQEELRRPRPCGQGIPHASREPSVALGQGGHPLRPPVWPRVVGSLVIAFLGALVLLGTGGLPS